MTVMKDVGAFARDERCWCEWVHVSGMRDVCACACEERCVCVCM